MSSPYLTFIEAGESKSGKTKIWTVMNGEVMLGEIQWYGPWRQYCYFQGRDVIMSAGCLQEVSEFLKQQMLERREK